MACEMNKLLSIVIANYNYGRFLEMAIKSVVNQPGFEQCELIVVDGGSTDESVDIIRRYENYISWWVSERDHGQSEAFNKGFSHATGKYLTWLNADDVLARGCVRDVLDAMRKFPECDWFTANTFRFNQDGSIYEIWWGPHYLPRILQRRNSSIAPYGPTSFFSKVIYDHCGGMDNDLHYVMDADLWAKFMVNGVMQRRINRFCWGFRMHSESKTAEFGGHKLKDEVHEKLMSEIRISHSRIGYKLSKWLYWLGIVWRVFDGSLVKKFWYELTIKDVVDKRIGGIL